MANDDYMDNTSGQDVRSDMGGDLSMPQGVSDFTDEMADPFVGSGSSKKFRSSTLIIVLVLALAAIGLFSMRMVARVTAAGGATTEVEKTIDEFFKSIGGTTQSNTKTAIVRQDEVLNTLSSDYTDKQIKLTDVYKNPFVSVLDSETTPIVIDPTLPPDSLEARIALRKAAIEQAAGKMKIKSILMGATPLANIDGRIVRIGGEVPVKDLKIAFKVLDITSDSVSMEATDAELELTVSAVLTLAGME